MSLQRSIMDQHLNKLTLDCFEFEKIRTDSSHDNHVQWLSSKHLVQSLWIEHEAVEDKVIICGRLSSF